MAITFPRPDPASPASVSSAQFPTARRGYDQAEVRDFLQMVAAEQARLQERERYLERELRAAQHASAPSFASIDEDTATRLLGEEAARVLQTAREAATQIRTRAEEGSARLLREATDEAQRLREEAEIEAARRRQDAAADSEAELQMAKQQGRDMVNEARSYRERVLSELARRREMARQQIEQLIHGRDRLLQAFERSRIAAVEVMAELTPLGEPNEYVNLHPTTGPVPMVLPNSIETFRELRQAETLAREPVTDSAADDAANDAAHDGMAVSADAIQSVINEVADVIHAIHDGVGDGDDTVALVVGSADSVMFVVGSSSGDDVTAQDRIDQSPDSTASDASGTADASGKADDADDADDADGPELPDAAGSEGVFAGRIGHADLRLVEPPDEDDVEGAPLSGPGKVDDLFARLRASRPEASARTVNERVTAASGGDRGATGKAAEPEGAAQGATTPDDADNSVEADKADDAADGPATDDGEAAIVPLIVSAARRLKRVLADEQNELLDTLRRKEPVKSIDTLLPWEAEQADRYAQAVQADLLSAAVVGARGSDDGKNPAIVRPACDAVTNEIVAPLRDRLTRCIDKAEGNNADLANQVRSLYREWKTHRIDEHIEDIVRLAYDRGALTVATT